MSKLVDITIEPTQESVDAAMASILTWVNTPHVEDIEFNLHCDNPLILLAITEFLQKNYRASVISKVVD